MTKVNKLPKMSLNTKPAIKRVSTFYWSGRLDSNQRPLRPERSALPGCATARSFADVCTAAIAYRTRLTKANERYKMSAFARARRTMSGGLDSNQRPLAPHAYSEALGC